MTVVSSVGWVSTQSQAVNAGFSQAYDPNVYGGVQAQGKGQGQVGIKAGMINLLAAVRTVMRSASSPNLSLRSNILTCGLSAVPLIGLNIVVIIYELILG